MDAEQDEVAEKLRAAYERELPDEPFVGTAPGVEVEVGLDGNLVDLALDEAAYRVTGSAELGEAIVAAHRAARESALAAQQRALLDVAAQLGVGPGSA